MESSTKSLDTRMNILSSDTNSLRLEVDSLRHEIDTLRQQLDGIRLVTNSTNTKMDTIISLMQTNNSSIKQELNNIDNRVIALEHSSALTTHNLKNIRGELILGGYMKKTFIDDMTLSKIINIVVIVISTTSTIYLLSKK